MLQLQSTKTQHAGMSLLFSVSHAGMYSHPNLFTSSVTYCPFHKHDTATLKGEQIAANSRQPTRKKGVNIFASPMTTANPERTERCLYTTHTL